MKDEYWATFSIYDHRSVLYRQAMVLFDRIVVPIPTRKIGKLTNEEIDRLAEEVHRLEEKDAAKAVRWDPDEFAHWRQNAEEEEAGQPEAIARRLVGDPPLLTRLMLKEHTEREVAQQLPPGVNSVIAVPVYGSREKHEVSCAEFKEKWVPERVTIEIILSQLPVPAETASLDDILHLRNKPSFQASLAALRKWQRETVQELLEEKNEASIKRATEDFSKMVKKYAEELADARYNKVTTGVVSILAIGAAFVDPVGAPVGTLAAIAAPVFSVKTLLRPCWKDLEEKECFPAGVIYEARGLV